MDNESPVKAILVVTVTAVLCSILVSSAAMYLQPIQNAYADIERIRNIVQLSGLVDKNTSVSEFEIASTYQDISLRVIDLETNALVDNLDPQSFLSPGEENDLQEFSVIPPEQDEARLESRPRWITIYQIESAGTLQRSIFPIYGQGMWSTIYGYLATEDDLNTIADVVFYEHGETAGIGDQITRQDWLAGWRGKRLYDEQGQLQFAIGPVNADSPEASYRVDGIAGATVTVDGVARLVRYWFGPHGYGPFIARTAAGRLQ